MTNATVTPLRQPVRNADRERQTDEFSDLLGALADLAVKARGQRARLERIAEAGGGADSRIASAIEHLTELEEDAHAVGAKAALVHNELQHARLI